MLNCLLTVGKARETYWQAALNEYGKRLMRFGGFELFNAKAEKEGGALNPEQIKDKEGKSLLKLLQPGDVVWAMCVEGLSLSSEGWAQKLAQANGRRLFLLVGGQLGLSRETIKKADLCLSLGAITLPHELAAVVALEQLYRAHSINAGLPYHRA